MLRIKELREKAGVTRAELAGKTGVSPVAVFKWETGQAFPTCDKLPAIAQALDCGVNDLFEREEVSTSA